MASRLYGIITVPLSLVHHNEIHIAVNICRQNKILQTCVMVYFWEINNLFEL